MSVENFKQFTKELQKKITFNTENLYEHRISLDWGTFNKQIKFNIYNNYAFPMSSTQVKDYLHNYAKPSSASDWNNKKGLIPCSGFYTNASGTTMRALYVGEYYNTTNVSVMCESVALPKTSESNPVSSYSPDENIYVSDYVVCIALNNVNKPSMTEYTTQVNYNGSNIGSCKWTLLKYPVSATKFKYEWIGKATCSNVSIAVTSGIGSLYQSEGTININQPSAMTNGQNSSLRTDMYSQANWEFFLYPIGSPLMIRIMRPTTATVNGALDISIYGSTIE